MSNSFSYNSVDFGTFGMVIAPPSGYDVLANPHMNDVQVPGGGTAIYTGTWGETLIRLEGTANLGDVTAGGITTLIQLMQAIAVPLDSFDWLTLTIDAFPGKSWIALLNEDAIECEYLSDHAFTWRLTFIGEAV